MRKTLASIAVLALSVLPGVAQGGEAGDYGTGTDNCEVTVGQPFWIELSDPPRLVVNPRFIQIYCPHE